MLATPDTGHFLRYLMRSHWPMLQPLQHMYLFSKKAMRKALEITGFNNIFIQNANKTLSLQYLMGQVKMNNPLLAKMYSAFQQFPLEIFPLGKLQGPSRTLGLFRTFQGPQLPLMKGIFHRALRVHSQQDLQREQLSALSLLLPQAIRRKPFSVNIGEMLVFCRKS